MPVVSKDRAFGYEPKGCEFKSHQAFQFGYMHEWFKWTDC